jgi:hypothetical protein
MRTLLSLSFLTGLAACSSGPSDMSVGHHSSVDVRARGVVLYEDGETGMIGMESTTCEVYTEMGELGGDYDFEPDDEKVVDVKEDDDGDPVILVTSSDGVHITRPMNWDNAQRDIEIDGVLDAEWIDDGFVVLTNDDACEVEIHAPGQDTVVIGVDAAICDRPNPTLSASTDDGSIYLTSNGTLTIVRTNGEVIERDMDCDLTAWDEYTQALYIAVSGKSGVTAVDRDGELLWEAATDGVVTALTDLGSMGAAAVMVELKNGSGELVILDGPTGKVRSTLATPSAAPELVSSGNGERVGFVLPSQIHFYELTE